MEMARKRGSTYLKARPTAARPSASKRGARPAGGTSAREGDPPASTFSRPFPTKAQLERLAALANIKPESQAHFFGNIDALIQEAHVFHKLFRDGPKTYRAVLRRLRRITDFAQKLTQELDGLVDAGTSTTGEPDKTFAYDFLNEAIERPTGPWQPDQFLRACVGGLNDFLAISRRAEREAQDVWGGKGRPAGSGGNPAFNLFIQQLYLNAWGGGGDFTNSSKKDEHEWSGSLIEALDILRQYLPEFFPPAVVGRAAQNILDKLRTNMKANRSKHRRSGVKTKNQCSKR